MKTKKLFFGFIALSCFVGMVTSCDNEIDKPNPNIPNAVVTIKPTADGNGFNVWVDEKTELQPENLKKSPYGKKEVRAIANIKLYKDDKGKQKLIINRMDSILTKMAIMPELTDEMKKKLGDDKINIISGFGTVVEDGYLTLKYSALTNGQPKNKHDLNLVVQHSAKEPYKLLLTHNANGDIKGRPGLGFVAFRLSEIDKIAQKEGKKDVTLQLHWKSYLGDKQASFKYHVRNDKK